jgi:predicted  nucleic acid-binding Zn-ribbon protein
VFGGQRFGKDGDLGSVKMKLLHDEIAKINEKWGLERGDDIKVTGVKHRSLEKYHQWLAEQKVQLEESICYNRKEISVIDSEISKAERRVKGLSTMLANLEVQKQKLEMEIALLDAQEDEVKYTSGKMGNRRKQLQNELDAVTKRIKERQVQLDIAEKKLKEINETKIRLEERFQEFSKQFEEIAIDTKEWMQCKVWIEMSKEVSKTYSDIDDCMNSNHFTSQQRSEVYDVWADCGGADNIISLEDIAECAEVITVVASALYLGYINDAVNFANNNGGGGSGPGSGWGRDKDDDDEMWRRKCLFMGMHMMRPFPEKQSRKNITRQNISKGPHR